MEYWNKRGRSFGYAWQGIKSLFRNEANAQIHLFVAIFVIAAGFFFNIERWEWCAVLLCIGGVFMAEGFNTAIEKLCDKACPELHPLIKQTKDIAAGAVLLLVMASVIVGLIVFLPYIMGLFVQ